MPREGGGGVTPLFKPLGMCHSKWFCSTGIDLSIFVWNRVRVSRELQEYMNVKTLRSRRVLHGLIKQREIELSCDISTGQYQSSSGLLRYHEFTEIYME